MRAMVQIDLKGIETPEVHALCAVCCLGLCLDRQTKCQGALQASAGWSAALQTAGLRRMLALLAEVAAPVEEDFGTHTILL